MTEKLAYYDGKGMPPALARRYFRLLGPVGRVLDIGCGTGELGRHRPEGVEVHGVDADEGAVRLAARFEEARRVDLEREPLPFADESFDGVVAKDVLEHLREPSRLVHEAHRVLRPGGVLVASVVMDKPRAVWADYTHVRGFSRRAARLLLEDAGFRVEDVWPMGGLPLSRRLGLIDRLPALLRIPGLGRWATSWELKARKA